MLSANRLPLFVSQPSINTTLYVTQGGVSEIIHRRLLWEIEPYIAMPIPIITNKLDLIEETLQPCNFENRKVEVTHTTTDGGRC